MNKKEKFYNQKTAAGNNNFIKTILIVTSCLFIIFVNNNAHAHNVTLHEFLIDFQSDTNGVDTTGFEILENPGGGFVGGPTTLAGTFEGGIGFSIAGVGTFSIGGATGTAQPLTSESIN